MGKVQVTVRTVQLKSPQTNKNHLELLSEDPLYERGDPSKLCVAECGGDVGPDHDPEVGPDAGPLGWVQRPAHHLLQGQHGRLELYFHLCK